MYWYVCFLAVRKAHAKAVEKQAKHGEVLKSLASELEDVQHRSEVFEEELASQQASGVELVDSQLKDYYRLQAKADKKSATLTQDLERVCVCVCVGGWVWNE